MNFLKIFLIGLLPIIDRTAIPLGVATFNMDLWVAFTAFLLGNLTASFAILYSLDPISKFLRKHSKAMDKLFTWLFEKTRAKHGKRMSELGHIALLTFIAVPIPGSGSWAGALVAYVFGVPHKKAAIILTTGLTIAAALIALGTAGVIKLF